LAWRVIAYSGQIGQRRPRIATRRKVYVGTAAWSNPPAERRASGASHLEHYGEIFNGVEINSSFYRSHKRVTYERWRETTPPQFRFSVKMPRSITHECALRHCRSELREFLTQIAGLGRKLSVVLVQTPATLAFEAPLASRLFTSLSGSKTYRIACEPRHASWLTPAADALLRRLEITRVAADPAKHPGAESPGGAKRLAYYRLPGSPRMYYSAYTREYLQALATTIAALDAKTREVWCVFDNTARHASWDNGLELRKLLSGLPAA
jgi:uncharacterized protein YecE (DUF72 family)